MTSVGVGLFETGTVGGDGLIVVIGVAVVMTSTAGCSEIVTFRGGNVRRLDTTLGDSTGAIDTIFGPLIGAEVLTGVGGIITLEGVLGTVVITDVIGTITGAVTTGVTIFRGALTIGGATTTFDEGVGGVTIFCGTFVVVIGTATGGVTILRDAFTIGGAAITATWFD